MEDGVDRRGLARSLERPPPGQHLVEHHAQRPEVRAGVELVTPRLLGRHVGRRPHGRARAGNGRRARELGQAEVEDLHQTVARDHQVGRLDVPVDDPLAVRLGQPARHLLSHLRGLLHGERPALQPAAECFAVVAGHGEVEPAVGSLPQLQDGAQVRVVERRGRLGLLDEPGLGLGVARQLGGEELEGHDAREPRVLRLVDHAHAAAPQQLQDPVGTHRPPQEPRALRLPHTGTRRHRPHRAPRGRGLRPRGVHVLDQHVRGVAPQVVSQDPHVLIAVRRALGEAAGHDPFQPRRHARPQPGHGGRIVLQDRPHHLPLREILEREAAGHHLVDHDP